MTYCRIDRNAQKATLPEEAKIDFSVYNLAKFTKHVFAKKVLKIKKVYCRIDPGCQKVTLLEEAQIKFSLHNLEFVYHHCRPSAGSA